MLKEDINRHIKIQFISRDVPVENTAGNATYLLDFMRYLRQAGYEIEYVLTNSSPNGRTPWYIIPPTLATLANVSVKNNLKIGRLLLRFNSLSDWLIELVRLAYDRLPEKLKNIYRSARNKRQIKPLYVISTQKWDILATPEEVAFTGSQFARFKPDVVVVNYAWLSDVFDVISADLSILKVILTHDILHRRVADLKQIGAHIDISEWDRNKEVVQLRKAQVLLAIQEEDARFFKEMVSQCDVISMPISAVCHSHTNKQVPGRCLFVGSGADHNYYGLKWFLEDVWLRVIESMPNVTLHVCGFVCNLIQGNYPNVRFLGRVDNLESEYGAAELCLVPLLAGSGLKIKLVEAMSYGRACISTSVGVQGLQEVVGSAVLVADTPEDFAAAMHTVLTKKAKRQWMEEQAHRYAIAKLSPQAAYQPFVDYTHQYLQQLSSKQ
ncbi:glycosyltransferase family 4 protein [Chlorogloeopsis sp. ULAP02]|uniref:glycosyltransferase family 4 protein n=1 Tax=Chlorogloeopsis sp. ULAP02 TaxID=3107926 RepID=UPI0031351379